MTSPVYDLRVRHLDGARRVLCLTIQRRIIDLQPIAFELPFYVIKSLAAQIIDAEAKGEVAELKAAQSNGILRPGT